jgi:hypothetical protein
MKLAPSNRTLALLLIGVLAVSVVNATFISYSYMTLQSQRNQDLTDLNAALNQTYTTLNQTDYVMQSLLNGKIDNVNARLPIGQYDYVIYRYWDYNFNVSVFLAKNGRTGTVEFNSTDAATVFNQALANGNSVYVKNDEYTLNTDIQMANKKNARLDSDGATLTMNGNKITIMGLDYTHSQGNQISGFTVVNGTVRIQNSFKTTVTNMIFENSSVGVELANTNTWSEATKIDTIHFNRCTQAIVFRTNTSNVAAGDSSTGSYGNTEITRCYFNQVDSSVAVTVEPYAEFTDGQMDNLRVWIGEFGSYNQTGLLLCTNSSMYQTLMNNVVFESFATGTLDNAALYAMRIDRFSHEGPTQVSVSYLGKWTARIYNNYGSWIFGTGGVFRLTDLPVSVGTSNSYGQAQVIQIHPATIAGFKPKITVQGSFLSNETVTVRLRLEFVDNVVSSPVEKTFNNSGSAWLTDDDFLQFYGYPNVIYAILVDAKVASAASDATVWVDLYGTTT